MNVLYIDDGDGNNDDVDDDDGCNRDDVPCTDGDFSFLSNDF